MHLGYGVSVERSEAIRKDYQTLLTTVLDELERKFAENPRRYFAPLANEYRKSGDLAAAIRLCREQLSRYPGHMSGHVVLGQALYESRQLDEAKTVFETALGLWDELIAPNFTELTDTAVVHGEVRIDPYFWIRDDRRTAPAVIGYLEAENRPQPRLDADLGGLGGRTFLHLHEEGVGFGLGDQANDGLTGKRHAGGQSERGQGKGVCEGTDRFFHGCLRILGG